MFVGCESFVFVCDECVCEVINHACDAWECGGWVGGCVGEW